MALAVMGILTMFAALNRKVVVVEAVVAAIIVILLVLIIVTSRKRKKRATAAAAPSVDHYADVRQQPGGQADPFAAFAASAASAQPADAPAPPGGVTTADGPAAPPPAPAGAATSGFEPAQPFDAADDGAGGRVVRDGPHPDGLHSLGSPGEPAFGQQNPYPEDPIDPGVLSGAPQAAPSPAAGLHVLSTDPAPGTPAGWLPDPGGTPDTLRYWDGHAWTPHVAQRS